jgi:acetyl esterase/lipase
LLEVSKAVRFALRAAGLATSLFVSNVALADQDAPTAVRVQTRYFSFQDHRYLHRDQRESAAALLPDGEPAPLPLVVFLHGVNPAADLHLWLGGGARDLRPLAAALMQSGEVIPFVLAAPSQTKSAGSTRSLWTSFELGAFVDAVVQASAGSVQIDRQRVVLMGHSGAGCNPSGGLATELGAMSPLPLAVISVDPCLDVEMGAAMARRPPSVPLLLWWQSAIWQREPLAFWAGLTINQSEPRIDRMQELEVAGANPHDAILPLAFERTVRELFGLPRSPSTT